MAELEFALVEAGNFDEVPDPSLAGASCRGCDYWESLDGVRDAPLTAARTEAKVRRLTAGARIAGSYGMLAYRTTGEADRTTIGWAQFGPMSAYPRAQTIRDRYPGLPESPPPYVVTCLQVRAEAGPERDSIGEALLREVAAELDRRGIVAVEAYPESVRDAWLPSPGPPALYEAAGFTRAAGDERFPVYRLELTGEVDEAWPAGLLKPAGDESDEWPLPLPAPPADDAWPIPDKPKIRNPFGED